MKTLKYSELPPSLKAAVDKAEKETFARIEPRSAPSIDTSKIGHDPKTLRGNKYNSRKTIYAGITFDSILERDRYIFLKSLLDKGAISDLRLQVEFELIPAQYRKTEHLTAKGKVVTKKVLVERATRYFADFTYRDSGGNLVVEDTKGKKTKEYAIKKKLMLLRYRIEVREIRKENVTKE